VDAQQSGSGGNFFQTDPEGSTTSTSPISAIAFDCIKDNSANLPSNDMARVHVQVHNRSLTPANNVHVWAVYTPAAGKPQSLAANPPNNHFDFWSQFPVSGAITPNLPPNSPWHPIGPPITLNNIDAAHPKVASWNWTVPSLSNGQPAHVCIMAFVSSADNPLTESQFDVDAITSRNPLVGQKNLHIGPPIFLFGPALNEYIEFNNPHPEPGIFDLVFDFRSLPKGLAVNLQFTALHTSLPLQRALTGVASSKRGTLVRSAEPADKGRRRIQLPRFSETIYLAERSAQVHVKGVHIPPFGREAAFLSIACEGKLPLGSEHYFMIEQKGPGAVVGGSTYVVRIARDPRREN